MKQFRCVILGDIHFPFHKESALKEALYLTKQIKPTHVVQIGDLYDQYGFSRFTRKNIILPEQELREAVSLANEMWETVRKNCSTNVLYQLLGNHDVRLIKRAQERLPEAQDLIKEKVMELYRFKNVKTIEDDREELVINDIVFQHGYRSKLGDHMKFNKKSTVVGHSHTGGTVFEQLSGKVLFELNAGYLADETSEPLRYRPQNTSKWTLGVGLVDESGPRFIPL